MRQILLGIGAALSATCATTPAMAAQYGTCLVDYSKAHGDGHGHTAAFPLSVERALQKDEVGRPIQTEDPRLEAAWQRHLGIASTSDDSAQCFVFPTRAEAEDYLDDLAGDPADQLDSWLPAESPASDAPGAQDDDANPGFIIGNKDVGPDDGAGAGAAIYSGTRMPVTVHVTGKAKAAHRRAAHPAPRVRSKQAVGGMPIM